jgi:hypothetical protein
MSSRRWRTWRTAGSSRYHTTVGCNRHWRCWRPQPSVPSQQAYALAPITGWQHTPARPGWQGPPGPPPENSVSDPHNRGQHLGRPAQVAGGCHAAGYPRGAVCAGWRHRRDIGGLLDAAVGGRVAIVSNADGAEAADACTDAGLHVAVLDGQIQDELGRLLPTGADVIGPVDTTEGVTSGAFRAVWTGPRRRWCGCDPGAHRVHRHR